MFYDSVGVGEIHVDSGGRGEGDGARARRFGGLHTDISVFNCKAQVCGQTQLPDGFGVDVGRGFWCQHIIAGHNYVEPVSYVSRLQNHFNDASQPGGRQSNAETAVGRFVDKFTHAIAPGNALAFEQIDIDRLAPVDQFVT
jgi:hypothetical protein